MALGLDRLGSASSDAHCRVEALAGLQRRVEARAAVDALTDLSAVERGVVQRALR
jgi:hypothetical protein